MITEDSAWLLTRRAWTELHFNLNWKSYVCPGALLLARANLGQGTRDSPGSRWQDSELSGLWSHPQESIAGQGKQQPDSDSRRNPTPSTHAARPRPSTGAAVWAAEWRGRRATRGEASGRGLWEREDSHGAPSTELAGSTSDVNQRSPFMSQQHGELPCIPEADNGSLHSL